MVKLPQGGYLNNTYSNKTLVLPFPILNKIQVSYLTSKRKKGSNKTKRHPPLHYPDWIHVSCDTSKTLDTSTNSTIQHWCCWRLARRKTSDEQTGRQLYTPIQKPGANHLRSSNNQPVTLIHTSWSCFIFFSILHRPESRPPCLWLAANMKRWLAPFKEPSYWLAVRVA